jgi:hypothetical protein
VVCRPWCAGPCYAVPIVLCVPGMSDFGITTWAQQPYSHDFAVGSNRPRKVSCRARAAAGVLQTERMINLRNMLLCIRIPLRQRTLQPDDVMYAPTQQAHPGWYS